MTSGKAMVFDSALKEERDYWLAQLAPGWQAAGPAFEGIEERTDAPAWEGFDVELDAELVAGLTRVTKGSKLLLFTLLLAALQVVLGRYSGSRRPVVGSPSRLAEGEAEDQGNSLAIVAALDMTHSFKAHLLAVRAVLAEVYSRQRYLFERLLRDLRLRGGDGRCPLFEVAVEMAGLHHRMPEVGAGVQVRWQTAEGRISGRVDYRPNRHRREAIERLMSQWTAVLRSATDDVETRLADLELLEPSERRRWLRDWNATEIDADLDTLFVERFARWVAETPDAPAVVAAERSLTYRQLDALSAALARRLAARGVGLESVVALLAERSIEAVVGCLGILRTGAAYLPLDPGYPADRLRFMIDDSQARCVVGQDRHLEFAAEWGIDRLAIDGEGPAKDELPQPSPLNLAYVIYTSGSTGTPKGVALMHRGLANLSRAQRLAYGIGPGSRILLFAPLSFDASVWEITMALTNGAALCVATPDDSASPDNLAAIIEARGVDVATLPPSLLSLLPAERLTGLTTLIVAGEACPAAVAHRWSAGRRFFDAYGPSEATVCVSQYECAPSDVGAPPIGRPLPNLRLYVVDEQLRPVPPGAPGELAAGGAALARGYLARPRLTALRFAPDPFSDTPGERLYRTGDLVRLRTDGELEYLGRIDQQLKVRGHRIEPGEIEATLSQCPGVREAVVIGRGDGAERTLVAYVSSKAEAPPTVAELRTFLENRLPHFLVPDQYVILERFPTQANGKIDRSALPAPDRARPRLEADLVAPRNEREERLVGIWSEVLGLEQIGVEDNFFELGGHSLQATRVLSRIRDTFDVRIDLSKMLRTPTISSLAMEIAAAAVAPGDDRQRIERSSKTIDEQLADLDLLSDQDAARVLDRG